MKRLKKIIPLFVMSLIATVLLSSAVYASTWEYRYPIYVTDTSGADRTYVPVVLGFGGQNLVNANKINANGLDTNMQIGVSDTDYMMSTTEVTTVVPSLPAGGKVQLDLYTGYSPEQTSFPIVTGLGGYVTVVDAAAIELGNSGNISINDIFLADGEIFNKDSAINGIYDSGNLTFKLYGMGSTIDDYPYVASNSTGTATNSFSGTLPSGTTAGDLLIMTIANYGTKATVTQPAGWTVLDNQLTYTSFREAIYYIVAPAGLVAQTWTYSGAVTAGDWIMVRIPSGYYSGVPVRIFASGAGTNPDPANLTSGFGAVKTLYMVFTATEKSITGYPAGYSHNILVGSGLPYLSYLDKQVTAASENPGTYTLSSSGIYNSYTVAVKGSAYLELTNIVSSGEHSNITASVNNVSGDLEMLVDGSIINSVSMGGGSVPNVGTNYEFSAICCSSISLAVSGTRQLFLEPASMLSGATIPDLEGGDNPGTITWGTNVGIDITYGTPESYESYVATANITSGFTMPSAAMPSTWFSAGEGIASLPFYEMINQAATNAGVPAKTIYAWIIVGLAFYAFVSVIMYTGSAFMAVLAMSIVFFIGSSMTIVPMWIPFVILITDFGIMYLVKQVSY